MKTNTRHRRNHDNLGPKFTNGLSRRADGCCAYVRPGSGSEEERRCKTKLSGLNKGSCCGAHEHMAVVEHGRRRDVHIPPHRLVFDDGPRDIVVHKPHGYHGSREN